jgi:hypothetical protein
MPTTQSEGDKKRRDPRTGQAIGDSEPRIPDVDPADLEDDQADSGPDRDRKDLEGRQRRALPSQPDVKDGVYA